MLISKPGIYFIKCLIDSKLYIGQSLKISPRIQSHIKLLKKDKHFNRHLQAAFNLYSIANFEYGVIEYCEMEELNEKEIYYIKLYNSMDDSKGYNFQSGGYNGKVLTEKNRKYLRNLKKAVSIQVFGFTSNGIPVKSWVSISHCASELKVNPCDVKRTVKGTQRLCRGIVLSATNKFELRESNRGRHLIGLGIRAYINSIQI